jgi:hypothetical protein
VICFTDSIMITFKILAFLFVSVPSVVGLFRPRVAINVFLCDF